MSGLVQLKVFLAVGAILFAQSVAASDWPYYQHDASHTGDSSAVVTPQTLSLTWSAPSSQFGYSTPVIIGNTVYATQPGISGAQTTGGHRRHGGSQASQGSTGVTGVQGQGSHRGPGSGVHRGPGSGVKSKHLTLANAPVMRRIVTAAPEGQRSQTKSCPSPGPGPSPRPQTRRANRVARVTPNSTDCE